VLFAIQVTCFIAALRDLSVAVCELLFYSYPALVAAAELIFFRRRLGARGLAALTLNFAGLLVLLGNLNGRPGAGLLFALAGPVAYAGYLLLAEHHGQAESPIGSSGIVVLAATPFVALATAALGSPPVLADTTEGWALLAGMMVTVAVGVPLLIASIARIGTARAAIISASEPAIAVAIAAIALGERPRAATYAGGLLVILAVFLAAGASTSATAPGLPPVGQQQ
jgi:drug/metabolite transporter, DME family